MTVVCLSNKNGLSYTYTYIYMKVTYILGRCVYVCVYVSVYTYPCVQIYVTTIKEKLEDEFEREQGGTWKGLEERKRHK